jgi:hypothetical protein
VQSCVFCLRFLFFFYYFFTVSLDFSHISDQLPNRRWFCFVLSRTRSREGLPTFWYCLVHCGWGTEFFAGAGCQLRFGPWWHTTSYSKELCIYCCAPTSLIFNIYLSTCDFPDRWKLSCVITIFKKSRRNNVEDYRGVTILSAIIEEFDVN